MLTAFSHNITSIDRRRLQCSLSIYVFWIIEYGSGDYYSSENADPRSTGCRLRVNNSYTELCMNELIHTKTHSCTPSHLWNNDDVNHYFQIISFAIVVERSRFSQTKWLCIINFLFTTRKISRLPSRYSHLHCSKISSEKKKAFFRNVRLLSLADVTTANDAKLLVKLEKRSWSSVRRVEFVKLLTLEKVQQGTNVNWWRKNHST